MFWRKTDQPSSSLNKDVKKNNFTKTLHMKAGTVFLKTGRDVPSKILWNEILLKEVINAPS